MKLNVIWSEDLSLNEGENVCIRDLCFNTDSTQLLIAANNFIYVYGVHDGFLIACLKGHKDLVLTISYSKDGKHFASGSADKHVIIWNNKFEGILKFSHSDIIRCLEYNPVTFQLLSCSTMDFGLWSLEQKAVFKTKISNSINCCAWSEDGFLFALGLVSGIISIRNLNGEEKYKVDKNYPTPLWKLTFKIDFLTKEQTIVAVDFEHKYKNFDYEKNLELFNHDLGFDCQFIQFFQNYDFFICGGSNKKLNLYSKDCIFLKTISDSQKSWIRKAVYSFLENKVCFCTHDGILTLLQIDYNTIYSYNQEKYVYRDKMTDIIIHNLNSDEKIRIKCHNLVKNISLNKNRLAIQTSDQVIIYENLKEDDPYLMQYKIKEKIKGEFNFGKMVVFLENLIFIEKKNIFSFLYNGVQNRKWVLENDITCFQYLGGQNLSECLIIGLENGQVLQLFLKDAFFINIIKIDTSINFLNLNLSRNLLAVNDENGIFFVYKFIERSLISQETNVKISIWNSTFDEMICCVDLQNNVIIQLHDIKIYQQQIKGQVIAFIKDKVFYLKNKKILSMEIPLSNLMYELIKRKDFEKAYDIACLKVTDYDWKELAHSSLKELSLEVSKKCFMKISDYSYLKLINNFTETINQNIYSKAIELSFLGDVYAYEKQFKQASKLYLQAGHNDRAVLMYSDLRMFENAQGLVDSSKNDFSYKDLAVKKAQWTENVNNEPYLAAEMYLNAGDFDKALNIMDNNNATDLVLKTSRNLDKAEHVKLQKCADILLKHKQYKSAIEIYSKIGDYNNLIKIYLVTKNWESAFKIIEKNTSFKEVVYVEYANWLAENDQFVKAQQAFYKAGKIRQALSVLQQLTKNAIIEQRFDDASYYCWVLSKQCLELANNNELDESLKKSYLKNFHDLQFQADVYFVYQKIHRFVEEPFTVLFPDAIFNMARYLFHCCLMNESKPIPEGVRKVYILYSLAKQSRELEAFKLARLVYEKLNNYHLDKRLEEQIELNQLTIKTKPFNDSEDLLPLCYRCSTMNPLHNPKGNFCINCNEEFIFSFSTFEVLPLVEIHLEDDISIEEAIDIVKKNKNTSFSKNSENQKSEEWFEEKTENSELLKIRSYQPKNTYEDNFEALEKKKFSREKLKKLNYNEVLILNWDLPLRKKLYQNIITELPIKKCEFCNKLFQTDEFDIQILKHGKCIFCKTSQSLIKKNN